jgi:hypothetical protein
MEARFSFYKQQQKRKTKRWIRLLEEKSAILDNVLLLCFVELTE